MIRKTKTQTTYPPGISRVPTALPALVAAAPGIDLHQRLGGLSEEAGVEKQGSAEEEEEEGARENCNRISYTRWASALYRARRTMMDAAGIWALQSCVGCGKLAR